MSNNETVKIAISGGMGKMGLLLSEFIENKDGYDISGIFDPEKESNTYHNYKSIDEINADILVEFSPANSINENLAVLANKKINLVVGSSGINERSLEVLKSNIDDDQFICIIPNFSIGASFQKIFSGLLNNNFPEVSIEERHHNNKKDSPSGTAVDMAQSLEHEIRIDAYSHVQNLNIKWFENQKTGNVTAISSFAPAPSAAAEIEVTVAII